MINSQPPYINDFNMNELVYEIKEIHPIIGTILSASCSRHTIRYKFNIIKDDNVLEFGNLFRADLINKNIEILDNIFATATIKINGIIKSNSFHENKISDATAKIEFYNDKYSVDNCNIQICDSTIYLTIRVPIYFIL